jgi:hypothetical protein
MDIVNNQKRNIKPEDAVKILGEHGTIVTLEEAQIILDLSYEFARISITQQSREHLASNRTEN